MAGERRRNREASADASLRSRLWNLLELRLPALTRRRRAESLPIRLDRHRIYVLPTGFGLSLGVLLFIMLLGALNYGNNPGLLLTCLLGAAAGASLFPGFRNLNRLTLEQLRADPVRAGQPIRVHLGFHPGSHGRPALALECRGAQAAFNLPACEQAEVSIVLPGAPRGWFHPGPMRLSSGYPLGAFRYWSWLHPDVRFLIHPELETPTPAFPEGGGRLGELASLGEREEYSDLRGYRHGDPPRLIAWKASARHDRLLVREPTHQAGHAMIFDYTSIEGLDAEARIRRLAAWVVAADQARLGYSLRLPRGVIGPARGAIHRDECLRALALLPGAADG